MMQRALRQRAAIDFRGVTVVGGDDNAGETAEGRIAARLAQRDFAGIEGLAVAEDQGLHHRMIGLMRLQQADAAVTFAPRTPDHLMQHLERPLRRARIAIAQS